MFFPNFTLSRFEMKGKADLALLVCFVLFEYVSGIGETAEKDLSESCLNGQIVFDECGRKCTCENGRLVKCCRLRKEFTEMSHTERVRYVSTVKLASTNPAYKEQYDTLLTIHKRVFDVGIHQRVFFLSWHRWFILQYENLLRQIDCRVTLPYWDWSLVGANPFTCSVWNSSNDGLGGDGVPGSRCVNTGPFRQAVWSLPASSGGGCLRRNFNSTAPDMIAVQNLIKSNSAEDFIKFEVTLRIQFHDVVHCGVIDGTMCGRDAATAPEFFLHHGFIDKIWWDWQKQSYARMFNTYFVNQTQLLPSAPYRSRDFLDLKNQPDCGCAEYVNPRNPTYRRIKALSRSQLKSFARLSPPPLSIKASKLFGSSEAEIQQVAGIRARSQPRLQTRLQERITRS